MKTSFAVSLQKPDLELLLLENLYLHYFEIEGVRLSKEWSWQLEIPEI